MSSEHKVRQRGKKKKKSEKKQQVEEEGERERGGHAHLDSSSSHLAGPSSSSWTISMNGTGQMEGVNADGERDGDSTWIPSAPFGLVDPDLKNYLKEAFDELKSLDTRDSLSRNGHHDAADDDGDEDEDEKYFDQEEDDDEDQEDRDGDGQGGKSSSQHSLLIKAILKELDGKELQISTDGQGSILLEYLAKRLDGKSLRIFMDRLAGNYTTIASHRFGSHVLQSLLSSLQKLISKETQLKMKSRSKVKSDSDLTISNSSGVLRSATSLVIDLCSEISADLPDLFQDQFGTHVLRSILLLLSSRPISSFSSSSAPSSNSNSTDIAASMRSKRSSTFRKHQDELSHDEVHSSQSTTSATTAPKKGYSIPKEFKQCLEKFRRDCLKEIGSNEIRALAINPISSPTLQLILVLENESFVKINDSQKDPKTHLQLSDLILGGLISASSSPSKDDADADADADDGGRKVERLDHLETLLRDSVGSHVLEILLNSIPKNSHGEFWRVYLKGRVIKLGIHPVANFVVSSGIKRLGSEKPFSVTDAEQDSDLLETIKEVRTAGDKLVKEGKVGILQSLVIRCGHLGKYQLELIEAIRSAFKLDKDEDQGEDEGEHKGKGKEKENADQDQDQSKGIDLLVPVILSLRTKKAHLRTRGKKASDKKGKRKRVENEESQKNGNNEFEQEEFNHESEEEMEATVQGSVLLQLITRLSHPYNDSVYTSLSSLPSLIPICKSPIGSHVILTALSTTSCSFRQRKTLVSKLLQEILPISTDKYGSRISDSIWFNSDPFLKSKIVNQLLQNERELAANWFGRFFSRKLNFGLFRKDLHAWKNWVKVQKFQQDVKVKSLKEEGEDQMKEINRAHEKVTEAQEEGDEKGEPEIGSKRKRKEGVSEGQKKRKSRKSKSKEDSELDKILQAL